MSSYLELVSTNETLTNIETNGSSSLTELQTIVVNTTDTGKYGSVGYSLELRKQQTALLSEWRPLFLTSFGFIGQALEAKIMPFPGPGSVGFVGVPGVGAQVFYFTSTSADDGVAEINAQRILIIGIDASGIEISESLDLVSTGTAITSNSYVNINMVEVDQVGSAPAKSNAGTIICWSDVGVSVPHGVMTSGSSIMRFGHYQIASGQSLYVSSISQNLPSVTLNPIYSFRLYFMGTNGIMYRKGENSVGQGNGGFQMTLEGFEIVPGDTVLIARAIRTTGAGIEEVSLTIQGFIHTPSP